MRAEEILKDANESSDSERFDRLYDWVIDRYNTNKHDDIKYIMRLLNRPNQSRGNIRTVLMAIKPFLSHLPECIEIYGRLASRASPWMVPRR